MKDKNQANIGAEDKEATGENETTKQVGKEEGFRNTILLTISKTLLALFVIVGYSLTMLLHFCPIQAVKFYEYIGAEKCTVVAYENQYNKTGELNDLYNLIQKSASVQDYDRTAKYIEVLITNKDYNEFCDSVNEASIKVARLDRIAFVADLDSYLKSQLVNAYYYTNQTKALNFAIEDLCQTDNIYSVSLSTYMSLILNDKNLTEEQKTEKVVQVKNTIVEDGFVLEWIDTRLELVDVDTLSPTSQVDKILMTYTSLKLNQIKYNIYKNTNEQDSANNVLVEINRLQELYNDLVK